MEISGTESKHTYSSNNDKAEDVPEDNCMQLESPVDQPDEPTKIIGVNDDCLVKIFNHLNLNDLCKVAIASEWLRPAAVDVYNNRKFGTKLVVLNKCDDYQFTKKVIINTTNKVVYFKPFVVHEFGDRIEISGLKSCLQYLRCFGSSISNISIDYNESNSKRYQHVHDYINEYCMNSLTNISFDALPKNSMLHFKKPLNNVTAITIRDSDLRQQLPSFSNWFPNVHHMNLCNVHSSDHFIAATFANLQSLSIDDRFAANTGFLSGNVAELLHLNPKLQSIELIGKNNSEMTMNKLLQMIKNNAAVTKLEVKIYSSAFLVSLSEIQQLANEHPSLTELKLWRYEIPADNVNVLIRQLNNLKKFSFLVQNKTVFMELQSKLDCQWEMAWPAKDFGPQYVQVNRKN